MAKATLPEDATAIARNRRVAFDYELGQRYEAGLVLIGSEVKTLRNGSCDLGDGWVSIESGQAYLKGAFLPKLKHAAYGHEERRVRKLLLHKKEIEALKKVLDQGGQTIVPTQVYWRNGHCKVEIAVAKGKKQVDKRQTIKAKELDREAKAAMTRGRKEG